MRSAQKLLLLGNHAAAVVPYASYIPTTNPLIWLRLTETSGTVAANAGGMAANATWTPGSGGLVGQTGLLGANNAYKPAGSGSLLSFANNATIQAITSFEVAMLIKPLSAGAQTLGAFMIFGSGVPNLGHYVLFNSRVDGLLGVMFNEAGTEFDTTTSNVFAGDFTPAGLWPNRWQWLFISYDDAGDRKLHFRRADYAVWEPVYEAQPALTGTVKSQTAALGLLNRAIGLDLSQNAYVDEIILWNRSLSASERTAISAKTQSGVSVVCDGDSIAASAGVTPGATYPEVLLNNYADSYGLTNISMAGQQTTTCLANVNAKLSPLYWSYNSTKNVCILLAGTNDISFVGNRSAAQLEADWQAYGNAVRVMGYKFIICNVLPRADAGWTGAMETKRTTANAWLAANYTSFADGFADIAANPNLSDPNNATYYADAVHPTTAGAAQLAATVKPVLDAVIA